MIVRLYAGPDGESHFEEMEPWHHAPRRQYAFGIAGRMEIGIGDGTVLSFGPGDVLRAEDLDGRGHTMRVVGSEPRIHAAVPLRE